MARPTARIAKHLNLDGLRVSTGDGSIYAVDSHGRAAGSSTRYPSIASVPAPVDLAIITAPAPDVPRIIGECAAANVGGAIVLSGGFREIGATGVALERQVLDAARRGRVRLIGPKSFGVPRPPTSLHASPIAAAQPGRVAFLSQSGALGAAVLDWSARKRIDFSAFISTGAMLDVGWSDLIDYFGSDPHTHSILLYMESIGNARSFLSAAREVSLHKPIIVLKPGRTTGAAQAAMSHTGTLVGSDAALEAAFRRCGVVRVDTIAELFYMAEVFSNQARPKGPRLTIVTNAGGPGVLAADALLRSGGELTQLSPQTMDALDRVLPPQWSRANPIDLDSDAGPDRFGAAVEIAARTAEATACW